MRRSTIIAAVVLAGMVAIYLFEPQAKRPETLLIIALMVMGLIFEKLFAARSS